MSKSILGQALIEYLFVFALFSGLALGVAKGVGGFSDKFFKNFAYYLTQELTVGSCPSGQGAPCWHSGYVNGE